MKIVTIEIYGFGKLENVTFHLDSDPIHVFYGQNEAGKSTIKAFINSMMFGLPKRNAMNRTYEPRGGYRYGGKLTIQTEKNGQVSIERLFQSNTTTVQFEDGTTGDATHLNQIFKGMDRALFEGIYSFGLNDLQEIDKMNAEDLGKYLYSTGIVGQRSLLQLEKKLEQAQGELFKPNGRNPIMNQTLDSVQSQVEKLKKWKEKINEYDELIGQLDQSKDSLKELEKQKRKIEENLFKLQQLQQLYPLAKEYEQIQFQLSKLTGITSFPEDGIQRYQHWKSQMLPIEARKQHLEQKVADLQAQIDNVSVDKRILYNKDEIESISSKLSVLEAKHEAMLKAEEVVNYENEEVAKGLEQLGKSWDEQKVQHAETSFEVKEQLKTMIERLTFYEQQKQHLNEELERMKISLDESERKLKELASKKLPQSKREELEQIENNLFTQESAQYEKKVVIDSLHKAQNKVSAIKKKNKKSMKKFKTILGSGAVVAALCILWLLLNKEFVFAIMLGVLYTSVSVISTRFYKSILSERINEWLVEIGELEQKRKRFGEVNHVHNGIDRMKLQQELQKDDQIRYSLEIERSTFGQHEQTYFRLIEKVNEITSEIERLNTQLVHSCEEHGLPNRLSGNRLLDALDLIAKLKERIRRKQKAQVECRDQADKIRTIETAINEIGQYCDLTLSHDLNRNIHMLVERLREEEKKAKDIHQVEDHIEEYCNEILECTTTLKRYEEECEKLLKAADVDDEEMLRQKEKAWLEKTRLTEKKEMIYEQATRFPFKGSIEEWMNRSIKAVNLSDHMDDEKRNLQKSKEQEKIIQRKIVEITSAIRELEEDGTYSDLLHEVEVEKERFKRYGKEWAVYTTALHLLNKAKEHYRSVRLPEIIQLAEKYFHLLTNGEYVKIYTPTEQETFMTERTDGARFYPSELSQATAEQLYLAIRLALAENYATMIHYPLIIDDSFVNFDYGRFNRALRLLHQFSSKRQILFFTCHEKSAKAFADSRQHVL